MPALLRRIGKPNRTEQYPYPIRIQASHKTQNHNSVRRRQDPLIHTMSSP